MLSIGPIADRSLFISKFIHGCSTLLPSRVDLVPFWLPQSMLFNPIALGTLTDLVSFSGHRHTEARYWECDYRSTYSGNFQPKYRLYHNTRYEQPSERFHSIYRASLRG